MINYTVISASAAQNAFTGSIDKILVTSGSAAGATFTTIEFGDPYENPKRPQISESPDDYTPTSTVSGLQVLAGTYVDGPIGRVTVDTATGGFLIYLRN
tara:strand:+ start:533 stop:829 length:297 start_codon:yes stop_codon:yes gene_type:complete